MGIEVRLNKTLDASYSAFAMDGPEVVGSTLGTVNGELATLNSIHVIPVKRRSGIGTVMFHAFLDWAKGLGAKRLAGEFKPEFGNCAAGHFYNAMDVKITDKTLYKDLDG